MLRLSPKVAGRIYEQTPKIPITGTVKSAENGWTITELFLQSGDWQFDLSAEIDRLEEEERQRQEVERQRQEMELQRQLAERQRQEAERQQKQKEQAAEDKKGCFYFLIYELIFLFMGGFYGLVRFFGSDSVDRGVALFFGPFYGVLLSIVLLLIFIFVYRVYLFFKGK